VGPRLSIVLGLVSGCLVAVLALGILVFALPDVGSAATPSPSPSTSASPTVPPPASASASPASPSPSASAAPEASQSEEGSTVSPSDEPSVLPD
jgi:hypothetical protein